MNLSMQSLPLLSATMTRRALLRAAASATVLAAAPTASRANEGRLLEIRLKPQPARAAVVGHGYPDTPVWAFNGQLPGPPIRLQLGDRLRVLVDNGLEQDTSVHWHGIRLPNAMDGVPYLTQAPIKPGETFRYEFTPPDTGTYWYHPHANSAEQVGRGLYGALIVEDPADASSFDRELTWLLDDWRLDQTATLQAFGSRHDLTHAGRLGNTVTINGAIPDRVPLRAGERLRLRLINVANARHFALHFEKHQPLIVALDGQPVTPYAPADGHVVVAPAQRVDLLLDASGDPGSTTRIIDSFYRDAYEVAKLSYSDQPPLRPAGEMPLPALTPNRLPQPDLNNAERHEIVLAGGAMGGMSGATLDGEWADIRTLVSRGAAWAINGVAASGHRMPPLLSVKRGQSVIFAMRNDTAFPHPMHLHGHHYRLIRRNGQPVDSEIWHDTVLVQPRDQIEVAFVADNPGDWMFHCHIPEHMHAGMMAVVNVS